MADKKVTQLATLSTVSGVDLLMVIDDPSGTPASKKVTVTNFLGSGVPVTANVVTGTSVIANTLSVSSNTGLRLVGRKGDPATSNAVTEGLGRGTMFYSNTYLYIVTDANTIKRVSLSTF